MNKESLSYQKTSAILNSLRQDYSREILDEQNLLADPFDQFNCWFKAAMECSLITEANAMTLSTAGCDLRVTSRTVLLKAYDKNGFQFFTNSTSTKGQQIAENSNVALLFYWPPLERQVKITGQASLLSRTLTEEYFYSRPRESQLGAWASEQSQPLPNRQVLEDRMKALQKQFPYTILPPEYWNGYLVIPDSIEFWQGRSNRLHDRFQYKKNENSEWNISRLSP